MIKQEMKRGLTVRSLIIGAILVFAWQLTNLIFYQLGMDIGRPMPTSSWFTLIALLLTLQVALPRLGFSEQEIAIIYIMVLAEQFVGGGMNWLMYGPVNAMLDSRAATKWRQYVPDLWVPKEQSVLEGYLTGGPFPWSAWSGPLAFWITLVLAWGGFFIFLALLMRRGLVDVEVLPFPMAQVAMKLTDTIKRSEGGTLRRGNVKMLLAGFLLSVIIYIWDVLKVFIPETPLPTFQLDYTNTIGSTMLPLAVLVFGFYPHFIAGGIFIPTDILFSFAVFWTIFYIIAPVFCYYYTGASADFSLRFNAGARMEFISTGRFVGMIPLSCNMAALGGSIGLLIAFIVFHRKFLWSTIKSIAKPQPELEANEPIPYRYTWIGFILCFIILVALMTASGMIWWTAIVVIAMLFLFGSCNMRIRAESGGFLGATSVVREGFSPNLPYYAGVVGGAWSDVYNAGPEINGGQPAWLTYWYSESFSTMMAKIPGIFLLESFKIGQLTKTRNRDIFIGFGVATLISVFTAWLTLYPWVYTNGGIQNIGGFVGGTGFRVHGWIAGARAYTAATRARYRAFWTGRTGGSPPLDFREPQSVLLTVIGVIIVLALYFARTRYPGIPLHPIGFIMPAIGASEACWFPFVIALIVKHITIKFGGVEFYEDRLLPGAAGVIGGWATMTFVKALLQYIAYIT